jgi:hypothetical protein
MLKVESGERASRTLIWSDWVVEQEDGELEFRDYNEGFGEGDGGKVERDTELKWGRDTKFEERVDLQ